jgi:hypothetical protein
MGAEFAAKAAVARASVAKGANGLFPLGPLERVTGSGFKSPPKHAITTSNNSPGIDHFIQQYTSMGNTRLGESITAWGNRQTQFVYGRGHLTHCS